MFMSAPWRPGARLRILRWPGARLRALRRLGARLRALRRPDAGWRRAGRFARLGWRPVLAALLGLILLTELLPGGGGGAPPAPALPGASGAVETADVRGWLQTILARPLFNPNRRPAAGAMDDGNDLPRLSAILIGHGKASAIFAVPGQQPLVVQPGGLVAGSTVQRIDADTVVLLTAAGPLVLHPQFAKNAAAAAPAGSTASGGPLGKTAASKNPPAVLISPKTGQPETSSRTAGPYDNE
ncbi:MAG: hypothetical protein B7Z80_27480 [Rhodospirillales bacterium 20-64-7]|nr:MAG: hypothetical protein B7Z80_27480 [Rhodospirillales bacterium 20-64-7]